MEPLRRTRHLARLLLACFALSLGVAMAAPLVRVQGLERLCSASGEVRWVAASGNGAAAQGPHGQGLECALCLPPMLSPGAAQAPAPVPEGPAPCAAFLARQAHMPPLSRAPFPPRAPPARG